MYQKIIDRLNSLNPNAIRLGLDNITKLLNCLGNPHQELNAIHIAGTNGKGSTAFFLSSIFHSAGYKTGMYQSPHLIDVRERVSVGLEKIPKQRFLKLTEEIFNIIEKEQLSATFFEFITALAFLHFYRETVDICILEVGLGGRFDATNVLTPLASIITEIGLEHTDYLGSTISEIALEKGGIIKPGVPVFLSMENEEAVKTLIDLSKKLKTSYFILGKDFKILNKCGSSASAKQIFSLKFNTMVLKNLSIKTAGAFQVKNCSTAAAVSLYLSDKYNAVNENSISKGLKNAKIPCRLELVQKSPRIVIDTAHNLQSIEVLVENITNYFVYKRLIAIVGILGDKNYKGMIQSLSTKVDIFIMTEPDTERALSANLLEEEALIYSIKTQIEKNISGAISKAKEIADARQDLILVTGSFITAGEALSKINNSNYSGTKAQRHKGTKAEAHCFRKKLRKVNKKPLSYCQ